MWRKEKSKSLKAEEKFRRIVSRQGGECLYVEWRSVDNRYGIRGKDGHKSNPIAHEVNSGGGICPI
jgi:hypothetical protein